MKILEATYRIVTPLFLGGADQQAHELRPSSLKGALRFWWRSLHWGQFFTDAKGDIARALRNLHQAEGYLFGTASGREGANQGRFLLCATLKSGKCHVYPADPGPGHSYLLGQGLYRFNQGYQRTAIAADSLIHLRLIFRSGVQDDKRTQVEQAVLALGLLGGVGSRARKGFGSLTIESLKNSTLSIPHNLEELDWTLSKLLADLPDDLPPFTAFSRQSRVEVSKMGQDPWKLLNEIGIELQLYRSWGRNGRVADRPSEKNFPDDHDLALQAVNGKCPNRLPRRSVFGLPHPYFFSSIRPTKLAKLDITPHGDKRGRRASPLFIHIHRFPDGRCAAIQTFLPAVFLPSGDRVRLKAVNLKRPCQLEATPDWLVIHDYLNRFKDRKALLS